MIQSSAEVYHFFVFKANRWGTAFRGVVSIVVVRLCFACFDIDFGSYVSRLLGRVLRCFTCSVSGRGTVVVTTD